MPNDVSLSERDRLWLVTGPNMGGKSTFLRQNALIVVLAQAGGFVPAASAKLGLVDKLFSRVGASDNLARGRSTFMVEMVETAAILNQADDRALVILDEIGRGTATYDGLSIAWAAIEHLHEMNRSRALFATHYHEMTALAGKLTGVENATVTVKEWEGDVIFLHEVLEHVDEPEPFMAELARMGRPGALYLLSVPAPVGEHLQKGIAPASYYQSPNHVQIFTPERFEAMVEDALRHVLTTTTALIVAHRPSTVMLADKVALMHEGKVVAFGTHQELLQSSENYRYVISSLDAAEKAREVNL